MRVALKRFAGDRSGATAIEYGLIASGVAAAIILIVLSTGTELTARYSTVSTSLK
jgi:pilus assembly protein Flp/PilA